MQPRGGSFPVATGALAPTFPRMATRWQTIHWTGSFYSQNREGMILTKPTSDFSFPCLVVEQVD